MATTPQPVNPNAQPAQPEQAQPTTQQPTFFQPDAPPQPAATPSQQPPQAVQDPVTKEWFLEAPTGTRYRTAEDAISGIAEKDNTISRLQKEREQLQALIGGGTTTQQQAEQAANFLELIEQDLASAQTGKPSNAFQSAIQGVIQERVQQKIDELMGNLTPVIGYAGFNRAVEKAATLEPNIPAFVKSQTFRDLTKEFPTLGQAIEAGQRNPQYADTQLPEILRISYLAAQARASAPGAQTQTPQTRPTPASSAPAQPVTGTPTGDLREYRNSLYDQLGAGNISAEAIRAAQGDSRR